MEGEAHRYSEHAKTLLHTIQALRISNEMDLIRGESLWNLDENARIRVMQKSYKYNFFVILIFELLGQLIVHDYSGVWLYFL